MRDRTEYLCSLLYYYSPYLEGNGIKVLLRKGGTKVRWFGTRKSQHVREYSEIYAECLTFEYPGFIFLDTPCHLPSTSWASSITASAKFNITVLRVLPVLSFDGILNQCVIYLYWIVTSSSKDLAVLFDCELPSIHMVLHHAE